jgi:hypothetical protein
VRAPDFRGKSRLLEVVGLVVLVSLGIFFLTTSWRKWPDPLIDFGAQLYAAWRICNGAVLYRDVSCVYGPLSQYFNAGIFALFGPGLIVMAMANIVIFVCILAITYLLARQGWGRISAFASTAILISVFGFSHLVHGGNYNYVTPYAHETTHGVLICLVLCLVLVRWFENPNAVSVFLAGLLFGLTIILKPEFIFAGATMTLVAVLARWRVDRRLSIRTFLIWMVATVLPTILFTFYFRRYFSWPEAFAAASRAWLNVLDPSFRNDYLEIRLLGLDRPWPNLLRQIIATAIVCALVGFLGLLVKLSERKMPPWLFWTGAALLAAAVGTASWLFRDWINIGPYLLGFVAVYTSTILISFFFRRADQATLNRNLCRLLVAALASTLMARMFLNPRIYHYGYYQAALAGALFPAVLITELPQRLGAQIRGRTFALIGVVALLLPGVVKVARRSQHALALKTTPVASGRDRFYTFAPQVDAFGQIMNEVVEALQKTGDGQTLLVLPEGEFINYLVRLPNPLPYSTFYAVTTEGSREEGIVAELAKHPPYWIVIITRDLWGHGIDRYGEKPGSGQLILRWVDENYKHVAAIGGDPLDYKQRGAVLLRNYSAP